tara:strand:- start:108 stop:743 length:636 start_codon:yes stop_codon:yes gene_type:complete
MIDLSDPNWDKYHLGNIVHGPGSYYLNDPSITQIFPEITNEMEALMIVNVLAEESVDNPPVMWQLTNLNDGPSHLILHRRKFFDQNLDSDTGKKVSCAPDLDMLNFTGKPHPEGHPVYYRVDEGSRGNMSESNLFQDKIQAIGQRSFPDNPRTVWNLDKIDSSGDGNYFVLTSPLPHIGYEKVMFVLTSFDVNGVKECHVFDDGKWVLLFT